MKNIATSLLLLFLVSTQAFSQHSSNAFRDLADSLYRHHHYQYAIDYYQKALKKSKEPGYLMLQVAKCFDKVNNPASAEQWFKKAAAQHASFTDEDYYLYAEALVVQNKKGTADSLLSTMLASNPNAHLARKALSDIRNFDKFFKDSALYKSVRLAINSDVAEFSPVYYKNGIVFAAAKQEGVLRKKYHWDNSHFLNLYYSVKDGDTFNPPQLLEKDLNTRHHDGPAAFYDNFKKMILNRNQSVKVEGREDVYELRPGLYDAVYNSAKDTWDVKPLPFNETSYSYAHPTISEDGNILYFSSDKPGGYGGMDLYKVVKVNGSWSTPFNLGPSINTEEDEAFPFLIKNTLYLASNGQGGLGGLDIFSSEASANGFTPPVNLGYPINSSSDDFSFITDSTKVTGYYASSRKGDDDIFSFLKLDAKINLLAHIFDGETKQPLAGASIQVITNGGDDQNITADENGEFNFSVAQGIAYIVIGAKDDLIGMVSDVADSTKRHEIPAYRDTTSLAVVGLIKNEFGLPQEASSITITDETTGEQILHPGNQSMITFRGEKGHTYKIEVTHDASGNRSTTEVTIAKDDKGTKRFTTILSTTPMKMEMAARIFRADNNQPLGGAVMRILTFGEDDQELTANSDGVVEFALGRGTAYVVIGTKDALTGMHSGMAEEGTGKADIIHPVPAYGDRPNTVLAMGLITSTAGLPVENYQAVITDKSTGEKINLQANKGVLTFLGERGKSYNINIVHDEFETALQELHIPADAKETEKFAIVLEDKPGKKKPVQSQGDFIAQRFSKPSTLLLFETEEGRPKAFITAEKSVMEISEVNGELYVKEKAGNRRLGKGTMEDLKADASKVLSSKGVNIVSTINLRNIYFDFDKSNLDEEDEQRLQEVKKVLDQQNNYAITIAGHADDRGRDNYNLRLSRRRTNAVSRYLIEQGVSKAKVLQRAFGESRPAVSCPTGNCSEQEHKLNRRAEFVISNGNAAQEVASESDAPGQTNTKSAVPPTGEYNALMKNFGEKQIDGISFKINIGVYKKNHTLTFPELADLGKVEAVNKNGTTYYTLSEFTTLKQAEEVRRKVLERGVKGASISIYHGGTKIKMSELPTINQ